ncbi:MAG TPA: hypothetical protein VG478_12300 [Acidimicrobiales bacterium]|jgi:enoyl-CoA hydratase|nr:hypothetical protein [Acidimicrobiales bacterium]
MTRCDRVVHLRVDGPDAAGVVELVFDAPPLNAVSGPARWGPGRDLA